MSAFRYRMVQHHLFGLSVVAIILSILTFLVIRDEGLRFLDGINLIFHEAGHMIFLLAPETMVVIAGSFMQLAIPIICTVYFYNRQEMLGTFLMFWWLGESMMNIAVYVGDARAQALPILGTRHDWNYLFNKFGVLSYDAHIAFALSLIAIAIMVGAICGLLVHIYRTYMRTYGATAQNIRA